MLSNIPGPWVSSFPVVSGKEEGVDDRLGSVLARRWRMLILIETVEHLRADGETASPEDIVSNEYANHESEPGVRGPL